MHGDAEMKNRIKKRRIYKLYQSYYTQLTAEDRAWLDIVPIGREFGSPDYERLIHLDALADAQKSAPLEILRGTVLRYENPTDPIE